MSALANPMMADHDVATSARRALPHLRPLSFELPPELEASSPPESRGMTRDAVRMLVAHRDDASLVHTHFSELPRFLDEGDLVVLNTSGTLAAEVDGVGAAACLQVLRSEERRVGKECYALCRSRWSPYH